MTRSKKAPLQNPGMPPPADTEQKDANALTTTPWTILLSALASMVGLQKRSLLERDFASGKAWHFIAAGLLVTCLFILGVYLAVQLVLRSVPVHT